MIFKCKNTFSVPWPDYVIEAFDSSGFVAGGFIRHLFLNEGKIQDDYLTKGDIDFFLKMKKSLNHL